MQAHKPKDGLGFSGIHTGPQHTELLAICQPCVSAAGGWPMALTYVPCTKVTSLSLQFLYSTGVQTVNRNIYRLPALLSITIIIIIISGKHH